MTNIEREIQELECPGCKKSIKVSYYEMISKKEAKCSRCKSMYKFGLKEASDLHSSIKDVEKAHKKLKESFDGILKKAEKRILNSH